MRRSPLGGIMPVGKGRGSDLKRIGRVDSKAGFTVLIGLAAQEIGNYVDDHNHSFYLLFLPDRCITVSRRFSRFFRSSIRPGKTLHRSELLRRLVVQGIKGYILFSFQLRYLLF